MHTIDELRPRLDKYQGLDMIYHEWGFIIWQTTTGENVEIVFIEVKEPRKGHGTKLIEEMCEKIEPFNSVIVFTKESNTIARAFYKKLGFKETIIEDLYYKENAVLCVIPFDKL